MEETSIIFCPDKWSVPLDVKLREAEQKRQIEAVREQERKDREAQMKPFPWAQQLVPEPEPDDFGLGDAYCG